MRKANTKAETKVWRVKKIYTIYDIFGNKKNNRSAYYESKEDAIEEMNKYFPSGTKVMELSSKDAKDIKLVEYHKDSGRN